ncbi:quinone-dependent dihydroorotate dehydrogenase [Sphingomonas tabacisoli]|uniref:Dihydroorotate dehydrogenase (quinone) n=1 Tax=Sphingomonas tabacisoli TaxID=2249466 RepID=A0ABW4HXQ0_9SPHN
MLYPLFRPLIHALDAEQAHRLTIAALKPLPALGAPESDPVLACDVAGLHFPNPVGLAAGFDKDAEVPAQMLGFGFGFVEVGTLTPMPQTGNPKPRLFRLAEDRAVINRMGFNNGGQASALERLQRLGRRAGPVGVNIGANKDSDDRSADYAKGARAMAGVADYLTVNISSPNTPGLRALQSAAALDELLHGVMGALPAPTPVFLKVAPDLEAEEIDAIARVAIERGVSALIVSNTTVSRPPLQSRYADETGGLSGAPLSSLALQRLRDFRSAAGGKLPLVSAGGIGDADEAYARIRAGASLVQLYSALVYEGPGLARRIARGLARRLRQDGFGSVAEAIGQG